MPERRHHRISSKTRAGGIGAKLGVYDDVFLCLSPGEPWLEHGIVEHRYKELSPGVNLRITEHPTREGEVDCAVAAVSTFAIGRTPSSRSSAGRLNPSRPQQM